MDDHGLSGLPECPHCGTSHAGDPGFCAVTGTHVQMAVDYVAKHPGCDLIDAAQGISPHRIARGYRAVREAAVRGAIRWVRVSRGRRLYAIAAGDDPVWLKFRGGIAGPDKPPLMPGSDHGVVLCERQPVTNRHGYTFEPGARCPRDEHYPLSAICICGEGAGLAVAGGRWHHHPGPNCERCQGPRSEHAGPWR
jgi:hypothetical protein